MRRRIDIAIGVVGGIGFIAAGVMIVVWCSNQLQQVHASGEWPRVDGQIVRSSLVRNGREDRPQIEYSYTVDIASYTSTTVSFEPFKKSGGAGRVETIMARYPVGQRVAVYYNPVDPQIAVLEPRLFSPFFMPLFFGVQLIILGPIILWKTIQQIASPRPAGPRRMTRTQQALGTGFVSYTMYALIQVIALDSAVREIHLIAFGKHPAGIPNLAFVLSIQTMLFLPMPLVFWHGANLMFQAGADGHWAQMYGRWAIVRYLVTAYEHHTHVRKSVIICAVGLAYGIAATAAWIFFVTSRVP